MSAAKKVTEMMEYENEVHEQLRAFVKWDKIKICDSHTPSEVIGFALDAGFTHVCQTLHPHFKADLNTSALMIGEENKFINFPLSSIFSPEKASQQTENEFEIYKYDFDKAVEKSKVLQDISEVLQLKSVAGSIIGDITAITDELFTNAIYNAPFMDLANTMPGADREDQTVKLHRGKKASIFLGASDNRLVIGCRDPYGTLNLMRLLDRVKKCYDTSLAESMNMMGTGGAGIGSFMVFNSCASYYAAVEKNQCTMICCSLPMKMNSRTRSVLPKNLHFIIKK